MKRIITTGKGLLLLMLIICCVGCASNTMIKEDIETSDTYLVGFDYGSYDIYGLCPIIICKVRYDKKIEADFEWTDENGEEKKETLLFDLTDEQYNNIVNEIDLKELYYLNPEELNPDDVDDGGCVWLLIYGKDDEVLKKCGGFCPQNVRFNEMRRVIFDNLPNEFKEAYDKYESYGGNCYE